MVPVGPVTVPADGWTRPRRLLTVVAVATVGLAGLFGCGGDDDDAAGSTDTTEANAESGSTTETTAATAGTTTTTGPAVVSTPVISGAPGYEAEPAEGPLRRGHSGSRVYLLQSQLVSLGYDPGPLDGLYGSQTQNAVVAFQRDKTLTTDGVVGPQTQSALATACESVPACPTG